MRHHRADGPEKDPRPLTPQRPAPHLADDDSHHDGYDYRSSTGLRWPLGSPGSAQAATHGCRCPILPNDPRAGLELLIAPDCPVHAEPS